MQPVYPTLTLPQSADYGMSASAGADKWAFYLIKLGVNWLFSIIYL